MSVSHSEIAKLYLVEGLSPEEIAIYLDQDGRHMEVSALELICASVKEDALSTLQEVVPPEGAIVLEASV